MDLLVKINILLTRVHFFLCSSFILTTQLVRFGSLCDNELVQNYCTTTLVHSTENIHFDVTPAL